MSKRAPLGFSIGSVCAIAGLESSGRQAVSIAYHGMQSAKIGVFYMPPLDTDITNDDTEKLQPCAQSRSTRWGRICIASDPSYMRNDPSLTY